MNRAASYLAAGQWPWKLLQAWPVLRDGRIIPVHLQFMPTNHCNANCKWCSCAGVDRQSEMPTEEALQLLAEFGRLGTKAITITGGGEPTIHPGIASILGVARAVGMKLGLVTNGISWIGGGTPEAARALTWLRISVVEKGLARNPDGLASIASFLSNVDIGVSFTVDNTVDVALAKRLCTIAESLPNVTHIRFVQELMSLPTDGLDQVEEQCKDFPKAFFQWRDEHTVGADKCHISLLKPVIDPEGNVFPCCGAQYAIDEQGTMPASMRMCHWREFENVEVFDGSVCKRCYYNHYNVCLAHLTEPLAHAEFL